MTLKPRQPAPPIEFKLLDGGTWRPGNAGPALMEMIVFYRGLHCSICKTYLGDLEKHLPEFDKRQVSVVAVSMDDATRARKAKDEWGLHTLRLGYDLPLQTARAWELFISTAIRDGEPPMFSEPGLFLIKADGTLFFASRNSAPWARPPFDGLCRGIDVAYERKNPARGEA